MFATLDDFDKTKTQMIKIIEEFEIPTKQTMLQDIFIDKKEKLDSIQSLGTMVKFLLVSGIYSDKL